jgi:hypothetical protein
MAVGFANILGLTQGLFEIIFLMYDKQKKKKLRNTRIN